MNIVPKLCELLGVKIGEEFTLAGYGGKYSFQESGLCHFDKQKETWEQTEDYVLSDIITGLEEIEKPPFEPKHEEDYLTIRCIADELCICERVFRYNELTCWADKYSGNCFRTKTEAESEKYAVFTRLTGRKWRDRDEDSVCGASVPG